MKMVREEDGVWVPCVDFGVRLTEKKTERALKEREGGF